jgi:hypothetical protein
LALSSAKFEGTVCSDERGKGFFTSIGTCGMAGKLFEQKESE